MTPARPPVRRALLKLSGEGLSGPGGPLDPAVIATLAADLGAVREAGTEIAVVVGGGNFLRGSQLPGVRRAVADHMGMLATAINGLALQDGLERHGLETRVLSAIPMAAVCEPFVRRRCLRHLEKGRVVLLVGGTGNPFFTTDTAAALRASEIGADSLLKATQVDGVYSADPRQDPAATRYDGLSWQDVITRRLGVMDTAAVVLCMENRIPIVVFDQHQPGNLVRVCRGEDVGTVIGDSDR